MYQTSACNPKGAFTPCNLHGAPNREVLPFGRPLGARIVLLAADYTEGIQLTDYTFDYGSDGNVSLNLAAPGILVDSYSYTTTSTDALDHYKWQALYKSTFPVTAGNETWVESTMAGFQLFPLAPTNDPCAIAPLLYPAAYDTYVRDPLEDLRLASAGLTVLDDVSQMQYQILFTNRKIWVVYARLNFAKGDPNTPDYFAFSEAVPVYTRSGADPINEFFRLRIAVGPHTVRYFVNDEQVFAVSNVGLLLADQYRILSEPAADGGFAQPVTVSSISAGFGTYSLLDGSLPDNYSRNLQGGTYAPPGLYPLGVLGTYSPDYVSPLTGLFELGARTFVAAGPDPCTRIWGQGSELAVQNLIVYQQQAAV